MGVEADTLAATVESVTQVTVGSVTEALDTVATVDSDTHFGAEGLDLVWDLG